MNDTRYIQPALFALFLLLVGGEARAEILEIRVTRPVAGELVGTPAQVKITPVGGAPQVYTTDSQGNLTVDLAEGTYTVSAHSPSLGIHGTADGPLDLDDEGSGEECEVVLDQQI